MGWITSCYARGVGVSDSPYHRWQGILAGEKSVAFGALWLYSKEDRPREACNYCFIDPEGVVATICPGRLALLPARRLADADEGQTALNSALFSCSSASIRCPKRSRFSLSTEMMPPKKQTNLRGRFCYGYQEQATKVQQRRFKLLCE